MVPPESSCHGRPLIDLRDGALARPGVGKDERAPAIARIEGAFTGGLGRGLCAGVAMDAIALYESFEPLRDLDDLPFIEVVKHGLRYDAVLADAGGQAHTMGSRDGLGGQGPQDVRVRNRQLQQWGGRQQRGKSSEKSVARPQHSTPLNMTNPNGPRTVTLLFGWGVGSERGSRGGPRGNPGCTFCTVSKCSASRTVAQRNGAT